MMQVNKDLIAGVDAGGTKINILNNQSGHVARFETRDYANIYEIFDEYFVQIGERPAQIMVAMAGGRNYETGEIKPTNVDWPNFNPKTAEHKYKGTHFLTTNDMVAAAAGIVKEGNIGLIQIKNGTVLAKGPKLIAALSTGVGVSAALWDEDANRYFFVQSEGSHMGFQPKDKHEYEYLKYLQRTHPHASAEKAVSGKYGIVNLINHYLEANPHPELTKTIELAKSKGNPEGVVLLEIAKHGSGKAKESAELILQRLGALVGSVLRDFAVTFNNVSGGIYLTGSVAVGLGEYLAAETKMIDRFIGRGVVHDYLLEKVPIYLVDDPYVAVKGALFLAEDKKINPKSPTDKRQF